MTKRYVPAHVRSAREIVATDRDRTMSERKAFTRFIHHVSDLSVTRVASKTNPPRQTPIRTALAQTLLSRSGSQVARVYELYRETVMEVDHYSEEYGDSLAESIAEELGSETAAALANTGHLTPQLRDRLIQTSSRARESRRALLKGLEHEHNALHNADEVLSEIGAGLDDALSAESLQTRPDEELVALQDDLHARERECDRQATLHEQRVPGTHHIDLEFTEYLYGPLSVTYPVLSNITNLTETLRTTRRTFDGILASREDSRLRSSSDPLR